MLPDVGATELMIIAAVALIVVGPKDLPVLMRKVGQFLARMRGMAAEFRASFDEMARQSELDELRREVQALRDGQFGSPGAAAFSAQTAEMNDVFNGIEQDLRIDPEPELSSDAWAVPAVDEAPVPAKPKRVRAPKRPAAEAEADHAAATAKPKRVRKKAAPSPEAGA